MKKRVLIVCYYWPPSAGSGVQRWLKLSKYLPENGWQPVIYTPENPDFDLKDDSLLKDISPEAEIVKRKIFEPYQVARLLTGKKKLNTGLVSKKKNQGLLSKWMNWIRGNVFIPDPRVVWVKPSVRYLRNYLKKNPVDAIITSGPPHSMHLIGLGLKKYLDIPWIVDIRDPFSKLDFLDTFNVSDASRKKYQRLESAILNSCDKVIATSYSMPKLLMPFDHSKFKTITNGYDKDDFKGFGENSIDKEKQKLKIYHAGLLNQLRNPSNLWKALGQLKDADEAVSLHLCGTVDSSVVDLIEAEKVDLKLEGYKSHEAVLEDYATTDVLLLLVNQSDNSQVNIPGKLFEYLATGKNIIGIGKDDDDAIVILRELGFYTFTYEEEIDLERLKKALAYNPSAVVVRKYSRRSTAGELGDLLLKSLR